VPWPRQALKNSCGGPHYLDAKKETATFATVSSLLPLQLLTSTSTADFNCELQLQLRTATADFNDYCYCYFNRRCTPKIPASGHDATRGRPGYSKQLTG